MAFLLTWVFPPLPTSAFITDWDAGDFDITNAETDKSQVQIAVNKGIVAVWCISIVDNSEAAARTITLRLRKGSGGPLLDEAVVILQPSTAGRVILLGRDANPGSALQTYVLSALESGAGNLVVGRNVKMLATNFQ